MLAHIPKMLDVWARPHFGPSRQITGFNQNGTVDVTAGMVTGP